MLPLPPARRLILFAFVVTLLWLPALLALRNPRNDAVFATVPPVDAAFSARPGVNLHPSELTPAALDATLARLNALGIQWTRVTLPWDEIEPQRGTLMWEPWDAVVAALTARPDSHVLLALDRSPAWARSQADRDNPQAPPAERSDFGTFARAAAERYRDRIDYYQIWHEPNIAPHWGVQSISPAGYVGLLREAALNIREVDPVSRVVMASLAPTTETGGANLSDISFLEGVYAGAGAPWFDAVAAQPYGFSSGPDAGADPRALNFGRVSILRDVMVRAGDSSKPLFPANWGWNSSRTSPWGTVDPAQQREHVASAFSLAQREQPWLGPLFWPALCPQLEPGDPLLGFLLCSDTGFTPTADAIADAARAPALLPEGRYAMDHPALRYGTGWRLAGGAADPPRTEVAHQGGSAVSTPGAGAPLQFTFYGTGVAVDMQGGDYWAYLTAAVDGAPANALPTDERGAAYLVLHDPDATRRTVALATGLPLAEHTVALTPVGGWGQWPLHAVIVTRDTRARGPLPLVLTTLAFLGTLVAAALILIRRQPLVGVMASNKVHLPAREHRKRSEAEAQPRDPSTRKQPERSAVEPAPRDPSTRKQPERSAVEPAPRDSSTRKHPERSAAESKDAVAGGARAGFLSSAAARISVLLDWAASLPAPILWLAATILGVAFYFSRSTPIDLALLTALGLLFFVSPTLSLPLIAAALPFWQQPKPLLRWEFGLFEVFAWVGFAAFVMRWLLGRVAGQTPGARRVSTLDVAMAALFATGTLSAFLAAEQGVAWREWRIVFLFGAVVYWLTRATVDQRSPGGPHRLTARLRPLAVPLVTGLLAGSAIVSLIALYQLVTGNGRVDVEGVMRVRALYGSPNNLALVLDRAAPLALALAVFGRGRQRWLYAIAAVLILVACVATFSKGALLLGLPAGIAVVLIGGALRSKRRWPIVLLAAASIFGLIGLLLLFRTPRFADLLNFEAGTSFFRIKLWQGAVNMALDHPVLGVGPDNFLYAYRTRYVLPTAWQELNLSHPHNLLLDLWTRIGLLGAAAGLWALVAGLLAAWRRFRASPIRWPLALGLLAALIVTVTHGLIDNSLFLPDLMGWFAFTLGLLACEEVWQDSIAVTDKGEGE